MKEIIYNSFLSDSIKEYIRFKCSLGYSASTYDEALRRFDVNRKPLDRETSQ